MPYVDVTLNSMLGIDRTSFSKMLENVIARALACPESTFPVSEVYIRYYESGLDDANLKDLMIKVEADQHESRMADRNQRAESIASDIRVWLSAHGFLLPSVSGGENFVWLRLAPSGFAKI